MDRSFNLPSSIDIRKVLIKADAATVFAISFIDDMGDSILTVPDVKAFYGDSFNHQVTLEPGQKLVGVQAHTDGFMLVGFGLIIADFD